MPTVISEFDSASDLIVFEVTASSLPPGLPLSALHQSIAIDNGQAAHATTTVTLALSLPASPNHTQTDTPQEVLRHVARLPGATDIGPQHIRLFLSDDQDHATPPHSQTPMPQHDTATLTGAGLYHQTATASPTPSSRAEKPPRQIVLDHDWHKNGPPEELFFDLSSPHSALSVAIAPISPENSRDHGHYYAIRFLEERAAPDSFDRQASVVIIQTAPGLPRLTPPQVARLFPDRLGNRALRAVAWIWLGNKGRYRDPQTGGWRSFGAINHKPRLRLSGPITFEMELRRPAPSHTPSAESRYPSR